MFNLELQTLAHDKTIIMQFVKDVDNNICVLSPRKIKPLRKSKHKRKPTQILLFSEAMEKLCGTTK